MSSVNYSTNKGEITSIRDIAIYR